ncbi:MAG: Gfo/Idh/MocA family protein [Pyrinomonadaceae bacterium]
MTVLKWGLIGAGDIAQKRVAPALRDLASCELVSVSRSRSELAEAFAKGFGARKWFAEWSELVADDEIDAVYIATPVYLHAEQAIAAAAAGKHVLCEKPMALTVQECDKMIAACRANNVNLGIAYYRRFYPLLSRVKQIIGSGELGTLSVAQINAFEYFDPSVENSRHWLLERKKGGGGPMMDFGCHRIEVLTNLFGAVRRVEAIISNEVLAREVEDTAAVLFQFESGVSANLIVTHAAIEPQDTLAVYGTKGSIQIPVLNQGRMTVRIGANEREEFHPPAGNVHEPLIEKFTQAVLRNAEPEVNGEIGRQVSAVIEEIYRKGENYISSIGAADI